MDETLSDELTAALEDGDGDALDDVATRLQSASSDTQKAATDRLRTVAGETPDAALRAIPAIEVLLDADDQSVRLTAVKTAGVLAADRPTETLALVEPLTDRLGDEFYYVRGRAAEALGHVAQADPDAVDRPTVLARLLNALSVDRPEIRQYVSEALARIALGDPDALRTMTDDIAAHLDDDDALVRYHLTTALAVVAGAHPAYCSSAVPALRNRLDDENSYVQGRAAETLGLVATHDPDAVASADDDLTAVSDDEAFVAERARFVSDALADDTPTQPDAFGDPGAIADATADIVEDITTPDGSGCPHCGEPLAESHPPFCPVCGAPLEH